MDSASSWSESEKVARKAYDDGIAARHREATAKQEEIFKKIAEIREAKAKKAAEAAAAQAGKGRKKSAKKAHRRRRHRTRKA
jgi:hypothetical protein